MVVGHPELRIRDAVRAAHVNDDRVVQLHDSPLLDDGPFQYVGNVQLVSGDPDRLVDSHSCKCSVLHIH